MERAQVHDESRRSIVRHVAFASFVGTAIQWYCFFLYGTAAALVFRKLFFPQFSPWTGTLASFATFGVAFFARPIGGLFFGHFGDTLGRKSMLVITLVTMGLATFAIGLLPTFDQVGVGAPLGLVFMRSVQGFALGGEWGGATLMAVEHANRENRNFYSSWPQLGVPAGLVLSTAAFAVVASFPESSFVLWAWRLPFVLSLVLVLVGVVIRRRLIESPVFTLIKESGSASRVPLLEVLRDYPRAALLGTGIVFISMCAFYLTTTFMLAYLTERLKLPQSVGLLGLMLNSAAVAASILIFSYLADRIGKGPIAIGSAVGMILFSYPLFWLIDTREPYLIWCGMCISGIGWGGLYGITGVILSELFNPRVRYSGISLSYQMAGIVAGAPVPIVASALIQWSKGSSWPVAAYMAINSFITLIALWFALRGPREAL
jgi:MFS transporter, MHS family, shikimate and dehydroshikimate transport protein